MLPPFDLGWRHKLQYCSVTQAQFELQTCSLAENKTKNLCIKLKTDIH